MKSQTESEPTTSNASLAPKVHNQIRLPMSLIGFFGIVLFAIFFLPWISLLGIQVSGLGLAKAGGDGRLVCLVPLGALWAILSDVKNTHVRFAKLVAGVIPLLLFADAYHDIGKDIWNMLQPAGYGMLAVSFILILLPVRSACKAS